MNVMASDEIFPEISWHKHGSEVRVEAGGEVFTLFVTFLGFTGYQSRMTFAVAYKVLKFHGWVFSRQ